MWNRSTIKRFNKKKVEFTFNPHLLPTFRGILTSIYVQAKKGKSANALRNSLISFYKGTKFVNSEGKVLLDWPRPRSITENGWYPSYRFHQPDLERNLRNQLSKFRKVKIRQNAEVTQIKNGKDKVELTFKNMFKKS